MNFSKIFFLLLFSFFSICMGAQQGFKGSVIMGFNAAQMDGDQLAGYNKIGLSTGLKVAYPIREKVELGMEMLYSQRGSQSSLTFGTPSNNLRTSLNYFSMPLLVTFKDWFIEEDEYYRTSAHVGFAPAYLFSASSTTFSDGDLQNFKNFDLSFLLGFSYAINRHIIFTARYTTGLANIYTDPFTLENNLRSYFLTFRTEYQF